MFTAKGVKTERLIIYNTSLESIFNRLICYKLPNKKEGDYVTIRFREGLRTSVAYFSSTISVLISVLSSTFPTNKPILGNIQSFQSFLKEYNPKPNIFFKNENILVYNYQNMEKELLDTIDPTKLWSITKKKDKVFIKKGLIIPNLGVYVSDKPWNHSTIKYTIF